MCRVARANEAQRAEVRHILHGPRLQPEVTVDAPSGRTLLAHEPTHVAQQPEMLGGLAARGQPVVTPVDAPHLQRTLAEVLDYETLARRIHDAVAGWGTDEEAVYRALQMLERDATAITRLDTLYTSRYGETLEQAIRGDFSGSELEYALQLINLGTAGSAQRVGSLPTTPAEWEAAARQVRNAVQGLGTDEEAIYAVLRPLNRDPNSVDQLKQTYQRLFSEDLVVRLRDEMSGSELAYALYLLRLVASPEGEAVSGEVERLVGSRMAWTPSGPGGTNDFAVWASAATEGTAPAIAASTTINCWEMVLLAAYRTRNLSWQWIHDLYTRHTGAGWTAFFNEMMGRPHIGYNRAGTPPRVPARGDIVFFNGPAHVALANGVTDSTGRTQILSFWPPPNVVPYTSGTIDAIKLTTIEELDTFMTAHMGSPTIEFATPPW